TRTGEQKSTAIDQIARRSIHSSEALRKWLNKMKKLGLVKLNNDEVCLTENGSLRANQLIRAHRLWEVYLVEELGLNPDQIHEEAEKFEHSLSTEDIDEMDQRLGFPDVDPHGSPIPR
ncbi:MAG TPA: iron dependent repressor, metal binding and dimerization domain protein, partial [Saprospiraceae bacterium]|nr:iron dependent repressor, metal binding and dimerization domain protein [Saprospiraceae bacterium]